MKLGICLSGIITLQETCHEVSYQISNQEFIHATKIKPESQIKVGGGEAETKADCFSDWTRGHTDTVPTSGLAGPYISVVLSFLKGLSV